MIDRMQLLEWAGRYSDLKNRSAELTGMSEDLLHVHVGLALFVLGALLLKRRMRSPWPLAIVYAFAVLNELIDLTAPVVSLSEPFLDIANTVFWPTVLFLIARRRLIGRSHLGS